MLTFERRYVFTGRLVFTTGLHVGGGRGTLTPTDNPVLLGPDQLPYIPGSSMKGAFRSTVEKLAPSLGLESCQLVNDNPCPGAPGNGYKAFNDRRQDRSGGGANPWSEDELIQHLDAELCATCKLFGSHWMRSRILFDDLPIGEWPGVTQIRDGVAIDRDSERARDRLKYDYEVVPPGSVFDFRVSLEEPSDQDVGLTCLGLSELEGGFVSIGGLCSRGLGRCVLEELAVHALDLRPLETRAARLKRYLLGRTVADKMDSLDRQAFLEASISDLLESGKAPC